MRLIMSNPTERDMIRMRQDAQNDWITTVNAEVLNGQIKILAGLVKDGVITPSEAARRANVTESDFAQRAAIYQ